MRKWMTIAAVAAVVLACASCSQADVFNMPDGLISLETVPVGNAGNANDTEGGGGGVDYTYNIGKFEVTAGQYTQFLNAVAATDTYGLYNENMDYDARPSGYRGCNIKRSGSSGSYTYSVTADWANRPVNYVSWGDAARFANWLHNGQPGLDAPVPQDKNSTEDGAYFLNGVTSNEGLLAVSRNAGWKWAIPTEDEWHKPAYHKNDGVTGNYWDFPMSNDVIDPGPGNNATFFISGAGYTIGRPYYRTEVGAHENSGSPYGTFDQGGNVWEWNEAIRSGSHRELRGGAFDYPGGYLHPANRYSGSPRNQYYDVGFRVVEAPKRARVNGQSCQDDRQ